MLPRLDPYAVAPETMAELISFQEFLEMSDVDRALVEIIRARVSQLNGCSQGIARHRRVASALGESAERLSSLMEWRTDPIFTAREKAALDWAETVTFLSEPSVADEAFETARHWFTEADIVKLTTIVAATNAWNRVERSLWRRQPLPGANQGT
jgi:AhpD family alkylhydroperoxidase